MVPMAPPAPTTGSPTSPSPWRAIFEQVRRVGGNERDEHGVVGSINWLRAHMERRGANPNVVRNIIYRDKGKLPDKRVLFEILNDLWTARGQPALHVPELEVMLAPGSGNDQEVLQLLGREKRRAYRSFVHGVRSGGFPKLIVTGRPGSGKTLLSDYVQQALEVEPPAAERIVRLEFTGTDLGTALVRLGTAVGVPLGLMESTLVKIGSSSAFAVQADAQADVARVVLDAARRFEGRQILLLHVSQSLGGQDALAQTALRLNSPDVPRVSAAEWLWLSLVEPLSRLPSTSLLVSMTDLPVRAQQRIGAFEGPVKLTPPTASEARRFVRARLPNGASTQHEAIVQRAGRSFEELRTLTLLAEIRDPASEQRESVSEKSMTQLSQLVETCSDARLRSFLTTLAVLSLPEFPHFRADVLAALRDPAEDDLNPLEAAFLDPVPGQVQSYRCFSRQLARGLRETLAASDPGSYRTRHDDAAAVYFGAATKDPTGEDATRYLSHRFEARNWDALVAWMDEHAAQQSMVRRVWLAASKELPEGPRLQRLASHVARHYVARGSYRHQDARDAFAVLAGSDDVDVRVWTALQRVEGLVLRGQFDAARGLLAHLPQPREPRLVAEAALANAAIARWRGSLADAERLVTDEVTSTLAIAAPGNDTTHARARARLWAGLIAKDRGDLAAALAHFSPDPPGEGLTAAREAFQRGDVLMRLGHFDRALEAFDTAVDLAQRSEALVAEQTRYLARRGTTHRRRGEVAAADADFAAARRVLAGASGGPDADPSGVTDESEYAFWLARVDDEASLNLLAQGRYDEAIAMLERNVFRFRRYASAQGVDATYRILRSTLRLAVAYGCRGVSQPFRRPFAVGPALDGDGLDLRHARHLLGHVVQRVESADDRLRLGTLYRDALLSANLFADRGAVSLDLALRAVASSGYPYQRAQGHAHAAVGALRTGDAEATEMHVRAAREALATTLEGAAPDRDGRAERGDLELAAWLICMECSAALLRGDVASAGEHLARGLRDGALRAHHRPMLRQVGDAAEHAGLADALRASALGDALGLYPDVGTHPLRFADALVARWERRGGVAAQGDGAFGRHDGREGVDADASPPRLAVNT
jgi:tetratricopeptide (TPR) repeat protein